ncbi:alkylated DNA repair protein alkB-like protein 8 isoform X1 [Iris pallida]|uniref:Alkylated DNA repair protein alkB-like protein 8 isoform X1 n=1 Tax=Iris pallida TaxID=29817 RepID=A0AAX6E4B2_IRIPA|nr:alkylated DNA repair protein alkB-like protein 8 isoform X1 [Iris pallida]
MTTKEKKFVVGAHGPGSRRSQSTGCGSAETSSPKNTSPRSSPQSNEAMRFGDLPEWATELSRFVREAVCFSEVSSKGGQRLIVEDQLIEEPCPLPFDLLWREPLFDQLILNTYKPYEGICAHVDLMRFQDGIAIFSLESACVMHFTRSERGTDTAETQGKEGSSMRIPVFLNPGSLVLMSGEARYLWKHEINRKAGFQIWEGKEIDQERRTSITLRRLCEGPN